MIDFAFKKIADEVVMIDGGEYKAIINRTTSRYRDLLPLLTREERLAEIFVEKYPVRIGEIITTLNNEVFRVIEVRESIDRRVSHCICAMRYASILRDVEKFR